MKTRLEELDELIAENNSKINEWLWSNHFASEPPTNVIKSLIDKRIKFEVEKALISK